MCSCFVGQSSHCSAVLLDWTKVALLQKCRFAIYPAFRCIYVFDQWHQHLSQIKKKRKIFKCWSHFITFLLDLILHFHSRVENPSTERRKFVLKIFIFTYYFLLTIKRNVFGRLIFFWFSPQVSKKEPNNSNNYRVSNERRPFA